MVVTSAMLKKKANSWLSSGWNNYLRLKKATIRWKCAAVDFVLGVKVEKISIMNQVKSSPRETRFIPGICPGWISRSPDKSKYYRTQFFLVSVFFLSDRSLSRMSHEWKSRTLNFVVLQYHQRPSKVETFIRRTKDSALSQDVCQVACLMSASADQWVSKGNNPCALRVARLNKHFAGAFVDDLCSLSSFLRLFPIIYYFSVRLGRL